MGSIFERKKKDFEEQTFIQKFTMEEYASIAHNRTMNMTYPEVVPEDHIPLEGRITRPLFSIASKLESSYSTKAGESSPSGQEVFNEKMDPMLSPYKIFQKDVLSYANSSNT